MLNRIEQRDSIQTGQSTMLRRMDGSFITFSLRDTGERYFTNADMAKMVEDGLIDPDDRWELLRGQWFDMPSEGFEHLDLRSRLLREVTLQIGRRDDIMVSSEGSIFLEHDTEVRPDLIAYRGDIRTNEMTGEDIFLIIEVMKSSHKRDMEHKRPIYAGAGVPELWLIDLDAEQIHLCREPDRVQEIYRSVETFDFNAPLRPVRIPEVSFAVNDLLGDR